MPRTKTSSRLRGNRARRHSLRARLAKLPRLLALLLPRYRVRTLMIAVAVFAVVFWAFDAIPAFLATCLLSTGPAIGACWAARRSEGELTPVVKGGLAGGAIQAALLTTSFLLGYLAFWEKPSSDEAVDWAAIHVVIILVVSFVQGLLIGAVAWFFHALPGPRSRSPRIRRSPDPLL